MIKVKKIKFIKRHCLNRKTLVIELVLLFLSKLIVDFEYRYFVFEYYEYMGFVFNFDLTIYIFGWILYFGLYFILYSKRNLFIYDFYLFIFLLWCLPNIVIYTFHNQNLYFLMLLLIPFILIVSLTFDNSIIKIKKITKGKPIILFFSFIILITVLVNYGITTRGNLVFDLSKVYDQRDEFGELSSVGIFGYLNSWAFKFFSTLLLAWSIYKRKIFLVFLSVLFIILLFGFSGHKSSLTALILVLFFYFLYKFKNTSLVIIVGFFVLIVGSIFLGLILNSMMPESLILRRLLIVPAHLNFTYLEYFSNNEFIYWSNSILKSFSIYPYDVHFVKVIGEYLGFPNMAANTGFIASGYVHAGIFGIMLYTFFAIILMNIINTFSKTNEKYFVMSIIFIPLMSMYSSSDLPTSLLTHGVLIAVLILYFYDKKTYIFKIGKLKYEI